MGTSSRASRGPGKHALLGLPHSSRPLLACAPVCALTQWINGHEDDIKQAGSSLLFLCHSASPSNSETYNHHRGLCQEQDQWTDQRRQGDQPVLEHPHRMWHCLRWSNQAAGGLQVGLEPRRSSSHVRMFAQARLHSPPAGLRQHCPLLPRCQSRTYTPRGSLQRHLLPVSFSSILLSIESTYVFLGRAESWYSAGMLGRTWHSPRRRSNRLPGNKSALGTCLEGSRHMAQSLMSSAMDPDLASRVSDQE